LQVLALKYVDRLNTPDNHPFWTLIIILSLLIIIALLTNAPPTLMLPINALYKIIVHPINALYKIIAHYNNKC
jgi:hypothetical protein